MKCVVNAVVMITLGWPSLVVGYLAAAIKDGFTTGAFLYGRHCDAVIRKFVR